MVQRIDIKPKQSLGQNFLIDDNIVKNIVRDLRLSEDDVVLEIGPGKGALTACLVERVCKLIVVEIDGRVIDDLRGRFDRSNIVIIHQDFLDTDLVRWQREFACKLRIVGNIPYHLTSPILFKVFDESIAVRDLTIMIQREVAQRIVADPGTKNYGILSVFSQFYGAPRLLFNVSPNCFYPKPKVTSSVVHLDLHERLPHRVNDALFRIVVKTAFGKRRKTLRNSLKFLPYDESTVERLVSTIDFPMEKRPEDLSVEEFVQLTHLVEQRLT
ncbi:MAG: ribosomal RNA small subunit methyltransferase A [Ignavibacteriae bacterium]|nr:ribosomal RNA small subunit methyltransferase A [Ignavibacteria bacterium]MBI3364293.1 ribosomal RNA small subunit methyltransferase A [Ignavibacteriota bacterium]